MPAVHAADWMHLAHHYARYSVFSEVAMPQIIHMLVTLAPCPLFRPVCTVALLSPNRVC